MIIFLVATEGINCICWFIGILIIMEEILSIFNVHIMNTLNF